jgi:hypothetical protein
LFTTWKPFSTGLNNIEHILSIFKASHGGNNQETGRLAAMDLVEVNPALAKTEADLGRCRGRDPIQYNFQNFTVYTESITIYKERKRTL